QGVQAMKTLPTFSGVAGKATPFEDSRRATQGWSYEQAFASHQGLLQPAEQARLRRGRVAIAGLGGVGGIHLVTLTRLGIGAFTIADPDCYEASNCNRQYGATVHTLGQSKARVMADHAQAIN